MSISVWTKYKFMSWISAVFIMSLFLVLSIFIHIGISFCISLLLGIFRSILLHCIKCPKCNKPINNWTTIFSGNNDGMFHFMSKKCKNCGYDFTEKED